MQSNLKDLPYGAIMTVVDRFRKEFFKTPWPEHAPSIHVEEKPEMLRNRLSEKHFEGVYMSYIYDGQVLDMRRPEPNTGKGFPMETHVRLNESGEFIGHVEANRYNAKREHINEVGFEWLDEEQLRELVA
jgi:hypothetical protein